MVSLSSKGSDKVMLGFDWVCEGRRGWFGGEVYVGLDVSMVEDEIVSPADFCGRKRVGVREAIEIEERGGKMLCCLLACLGRVESRKWKVEGSLKVGYI